MVKQKIMKRREAKALGLEYYNTGKPCKRGHLSLRKVKDGSCPDCTQAYYLENQERILSSSREYYLQHKKETATYQREYRLRNLERIREQERVRRKNNPNYNTSRAAYYWENREKLLELSNAAQRKKYANSAEYREKCSRQSAAYYEKNKVRIKRHCNDYYHITQVLKKYGKEK